VRSSSYLHRIYKALASKKTQEDHNETVILIIINVLPRHAIKTSQGFFKLTCPIIWLFACSMTNKNLPKVSRKRVPLSVPTSFLITLKRRRKALHSRPTLSGSSHILSHACSPGNLRSFMASSRAYIEWYETCLLGHICWAFWTSSQIWPESKFAPAKGGICKEIWLTRWAFDWTPYQTYTHPNDEDLT
jgi:hypothetical protein